MSRTDAVSTARAALQLAEATNQALGHENAGFLSERLGFVPAREPERALPPPFSEWDDIAWRLPELMGSLELRSEIARLSLLQAAPTALPDAHLLRAAHVLAMLSHAYVYAEPGAPKPPPATLMAPWAEVCRRLGRPTTAMSYVDLIVYNFRFVDAALADPFRVDNLRLLTPAFDTREEHVFYLTQVEILAQGAPIVGAAVRAQEAVLTRDEAALELELCMIEECLRSLTQRSLSTIDPVRGRPTHVDPVIWAKTVAPFGVPISPGVQGPSGTSSPLFGLLDAFVGRTRHDSLLGIEIRGLRSMYPPSWRSFLLAIEQAPVLDYVDRSSPSVRAAFAALLDAYSGPDGFLGRHRRKVYGYLELAFKVGREMTIGGFGGVFAERTWDRVDTELDKARNERPSSQPSPRPSGAPRAAAPPTAEIDASELIQHNDRERGHWLAIDGEVLDVSGFVERHPGGAHTIEGHAGTDATNAYRRAHKHDALPLSLRKTLVIGRLRTCADVARRRGDCAESARVGFHQQSQKLAYLTTEMQNALYLDARFFSCADAGRPRTNYELARAIEGQNRFFRSYLSELLSRSFEAVLSAAANIDAGASDALRQALAALQASNTFVRAAGLPEELAQALTAAREGKSGSAEELSARCRELERKNGLVLRRIKAELTDALRTLEQTSSVSLVPFGRVVEHAAHYAAEVVSERTVP